VRAAGWRRLSVALCRRTPTTGSKLEWRGAQALVADELAVALDLRSDPQTLALQKDEASGKP